jgi:hypothetical protein
VPAEKDQFLSGLFQLFEPVQPAAGGIDDDDIGCGQLLF